ncbi:AAA family ATPase [Odoribacter laneus]|uniref:AAA family ATPase n=1 Tax=Odoribacter laneus TaxID=626933 RepID=UPI0023F35AFE|nr:AAA family ATPase [Odoribacter laneus]
MYISSIVLENFRLYKGFNQIDFPLDSAKNVFVIAGDNGFGKTTFLTSLVWCLYGRQMADVDDKFKREIAEAGGYKNYARSNLNKSLLMAPELKMGETFYAVTIVFSGVVVNAVLCNSISVRRTYDISTNEEKVEVLIDGKANELTKEMGPDFFINDYILNKEIARFFFFDSEKIVSLAEIKSLADKRQLSMAYSEVLGIKKYEDLKSNLENVRLRLRRKSDDIKERDKLNVLLKKKEEGEKRLQEQEDSTKMLESEIAALKSQSDDIQIALIKEGNANKLEELKKQQLLLDTLKGKDEAYRNDLIGMLDIAPFAIGGNRFREVVEQAKKEMQFTHDKSFIEVQNQLLDTVKAGLMQNLQQTDVGVSAKEVFARMLEDSFKSHYKSTQEVDEVEILLGLTEEQTNELAEIYEHLKTSYRLIFKRLVEDYRRNRYLMDKTGRRIATAVAKEEDSVVKKHRREKEGIDRKIEEKTRLYTKNLEEKGRILQELAVLQKQVNELAKKVSLDDIDREKDRVAERLIRELTAFLVQFKSEKKLSLEQHIKANMNMLMHKDDFVHRVEVTIAEDLIDIRLYNRNETEIPTELLSKGEQQLYATSILKALVDESEMQFPIFIDSPLQKFDKRHATKIITEFYPRISKQVVIFPLLEKELTLDEYEDLFPFVNSVYYIRNLNGASCFEQVTPEKLFAK